MDNSRKPAEVISDFLTYLDYAKTEYSSSKGAYEHIDGQTYDWCHKFENAKNKQERNRLATAFHNLRIERRQHKDKAKLFEKLAHFAQDKSNELFLKRLRKMLADQIKTEEWLESDRAGEGDTHD
ncbi:MAG: hypothetical protein Q4F83_11005 [Eubacteriales bacterium]|nr:hypothetical protein [Eubacteriales bacterium]